MTDGPDIALIARLLGDHARADMLMALLADQALTATELAGVAMVTKQTASSHLAKLVDARLVTVERQGRHRYFRLADPDVADLLERLTGLASRTGDYPDVKTRIESHLAETRRQAEELEECIRRRGGDTSAARRTR